MSHGRRQHLTGLGVLAASLALSERSPAMPQPHYGGTLRLTLPTALASLNPHDAEDLTCALLGCNAFEPLFALGPSGQPYATLADGLPTLDGSRLKIKLRPELLDSRGNGVTSESVVASLLRARRALPLLSELGEPRREGATLVSLPAADPLVIAKRLALPQTAIVAKNFRPTAPDGTGPFSVNQLGTRLVLSQNPNAARGGAFLDRVEVTSSDLSGCLRAFESGASEIGWLGNGLHQPRPGAVPFQLETVGLLVLLAGQGLGRLRAPGVLQAALDGTKSRALDSLGVVRSAPSSAVAFPGRPLRISCPSDSPQLRATAEALAEAWTTSNGSVQVQPVGTAELRTQRSRGDFDVLLTFVRTAGLSARDSHALLLALDGAVLPQQFTAEAPTRLARRLGLGVVGALTPQGATLGAWGRWAIGAQFELGDVTLPRPV